MSANLTFLHRFVPGDSARPLLLLHGTGGDEHELVERGALVAPGMALISPRGQVQEGSLNRFFRRFSENVFDVDDLKARTHLLADFIGEARAAYGLGKPVVMGFSSGANMAASLLMLRPEVVAGAMLLRAIHIYSPETTPDLSAHPVLFLSGGFDSLMTVEQARPLGEWLTGAGAPLTRKVLRTGHPLTDEDTCLALDWRRTHFPD